MRPMQVHTLELRGEHIELDKLLKATGLADSGGQARAFIAAGEVTVDGQVELRKTAKMRAGQTVQFNGEQVNVVAARTP
jgi:ribosome-associated protein